MPAVIRDLVVEVNADFELIFIIKDKVTHEVMDLSGYSAHMVAKSLDGATTLIDINPTVSGPAGMVTVFIPKLTTATYTWEQGQYDLVLAGLKTFRLLQGYVSTSPGVTPVS